MTLRLGQTSPDFEQDTTNGSLRLYGWLGGAWGLLFSYPGDFMPVSTAELIEVERLMPEWRKRGVKPIGLSLDNADRHRAFEREVASSIGRGFSFPLVADSDRAVAMLYGMADLEADPGITASCIFVIDPCKRVRLILAHPPGIARSFHDLLRTIDRLQAAVTIPHCALRSATAGAAL